MGSSKIFKLNMSPAEVEKFQTHLMQSSGLVFEGRRVQELQHAVATRMIELGLSSFEEYYRHLSDRERSGDELSRLVLSLTVGETQFFRTPDQFAALRKFVLPELIEKKRGRNQTLVVVSAGCATGEEPYTLSLLLHDLLPDHEAWNISIRACDINQEFLNAARAGVYGERKMRLVDPDTRARYFDRVGKNQWRVKEFLGRWIKWSHFNIISDDYSPLLSPFSRADLILCRNVLIYFNFETIKSVIARFHRLLEDEGYLMLGYSESLFRINEAFQSVHTPEAFFYQKISRPVRPAPALPEKTSPLEREELLTALGSRPHPWTAKAAEPDPFGKLRRLAPTRPAEDPKPLAGSREARATAGPDDHAQAPDDDFRLDTASEDQLWERGLELFAEERFEEAGRAFERMLSLNPRSARGHLGLGFLLANQGAESKSREHLEKARRQDDLIPEIYFLFALLDEKAGELDRAARHYQNVILLAPDFAMARFNLANLFMKQNRLRDARREFGNVIEILERDHDNRSLKFSGGLSRDAVLSFCKLQREQIGRVARSADRAGRRGA